MIAVGKNARCILENLSLGIGKVHGSGGVGDENTRRGRRYY